MTIASKQIEAHLKMLVETIGVRLAGSPGERRAADYIAAQCEAAGARVTIEEFPVLERHVEDERLEVESHGNWTSHACSLFSNTPGTEGRTIAAPLVFFDPRTEYQRPDLAFLRGKAVVHLGCHIESRDAYRRLIEAGPAFLLFVDVRYPGTAALADGMFPAYARAIGAVPTVNVAYMDAWQWKVNGATRARLCVRGGMRAAVSQNVIAELSGTGPELLFAGGHHDTQAGSPGADDNAVSAACLIELTRVLAHVPRTRTIRLISFGAEEQLSVGSAAYVRRHRTELQSHGRLMFNVDACGSHLGWTGLWSNGPRQLGDYLLPFFTGNGEWVQLRPELTPYADHFPFVAAGVPSGFLHRENCAGGRFFHHRPDDDMSRVSVPLVTSLTACTAQLLAHAANATLPFPKRIDGAMADEVRRIWEDLFGGWE